MEFRKQSLFPLTLLLAIFAVAAARADESAAFQIATGEMDLWETAMPFYDGDQFGATAAEEDESIDGEPNRRSLFWKRAIHYYISYGALTANRIPCPARSGRSYYTHNCFRASGPVHPYSRGCSAITRCRR